MYYGTIMCVVGINTLLNWYHLISHALYIVL